MAAKARSRFLPNTPIERLRVIFPATKNTQRLGSLILIAALASTSRAISAVSLATKYRSILTAPVTLSPKEWEELRPYLGKRNLLRKYDSKRLQVEVQDWLLSDPGLPSGTGAEKEDAEAAVDLAVQLGILWPQTHQRTWVGEYLADLRPNIVESFRNADWEANPFRLSDEERLLLAWTCLRRDAHFLGYLAGILCSMGSPITTAHLEQTLRSSYGDFVERVRQLRSSPADTAIVKRLEAIGVRLQQKTVGRKSAAGPGVTDQTARRLFEELAYWRLEALVDLGYLAKDDPSGYTYKTRKGLADLDRFGRANVQETLEKEFFRDWRRVMFGSECSRLTGVEARARLFAANRARQNSMGYTLVEEGVLTANRLLQKQGLSDVLEFSDAEEALLTGSDSDYKVLTSVDRQRRLSAFKMVARAASG